MQHLKFVVNEAMTLLLHAQVTIKKQFYASRAHQYYDYFQTAHRHTMIDIRSLFCKYDLPHKTFVSFETHLASNHFSRFSAVKAHATSTGIYGAIWSRPKRHVVVTLY